MYGCVCVCIWLSRPILNRTLSLCLSLRHIRASRSLCACVCVCEFYRIYLHILLVLLLRVVAAVLGGGGLTSGSPCATGTCPIWRRCWTNPGRSRPTTTGCCWCAGSAGRPSRSGCGSCARPDWWRCRCASTICWRRWRLISLQATWLYGNRVVVAICIFQAPYTIILQIR